MAQEEEFENAIYVEVRVRKGITMRWLELLRADPRRFAILVVGALFVAMVIAGVVGLLLNQHVRETTEEALRYDIELESRANEVREAVLELNHYHRGPGRDIDDFEQAYAQLREKIDRLDELGVRVSEAPQPERLRQMSESYYADFRPAIDEYDSSRPEAFAAANNHGLLALAELERAAWEVQSLNKERLEAALDTVAAANDTARVVLLARIGGLFLIAVVLAYVVMRTISELRGLYAREKKVAEELAESEERMRFEHVSPNGIEQRNKAIYDEAGDLVAEDRRVEAPQYQLDLTRTITNNAADSLFLWDVKGRVTFMNPAAEQTFGWRQEELLGEVLHHVMHHHYPDGRPYPISECPLVRVAESGQTLCDHEDLFFRKDGSPLDVACSHAPIVVDGKITGTVLVVRDITKRKRAEEDLKQSEERYRSLVAVSTSIVWTTDAEGRFVQPQPPWKAYTGQPWEEQKGFGWVQALHPDDRERVRAIWEQACERCEQYASDGRLWHVPSQSYRHFIARAAPLFDADGSVREWIGMIADVEDQKRAEEALRRSEAHYSAIVDTAFDAIVTITADSTVRSFNQGAERIFGYTAQETIGQPLTLLMPERFRKRHEAGLVRYLRTGETRIVGQRMIELVGLRKDGEEFPLELSIAEVREGQDLLFTGIMRDITDRKRIEEELAVSLQSKRDFLADVSHELRTPLTTIRTNAEVGLEIERDCIHARLLKEIVKGSARMSRLIEDLLFLARSDSDSPPLEFEPVALPLFLAEVAKRAEDLALARGAIFEARLSVEEGRLSIDPARIEQAVLILVDNAARYSPPGSLVTLASTTGDDELCVSVQDIGPGIAEADLPHIFERFYRGKKMRTDNRSRAGLGLGLAIARAIAEVHGGRIEAASQLGEGTRMSLYLPLTSTETGIRPFMRNSSKTSLFT